MLNRGRWTWRRHAAAIVGLTVVAGGVRVFRLGEPSLWYDEVRTMQATLAGDPQWTKSFSNLPDIIWYGVKGIEASAALAGEPERWRGMGLDEVTSRIPACALGTVTVPLLYIVGCGVVGPAVSLGAAGLLAMNMWHVYWSQSARFYAWQFLLYNLSLLFYLRWMSGRRVGGGSGWVSAVLAMVLLAMAALTQPTAVVLYGVFVVDALIRTIWGDDRQAGKRVLLGLAVPAMLIGAALAVDVVQRTDRWTEFFEGPNLAAGRLLFSSAYFMGPAVFLAGCLGGWLAVGNRNSTMITAVLAAVLPIAAFSIVGLFARVELRYTLVSLYGWLCLASFVGGRFYDVSRTRLGHGGAAAVMGCLLAAAGQPLFEYTKSNGLRPETREAVNYVNRSRGPGDLIYMDPLEGAYYFGEPMAGDAPGVAHDEERATMAAWVLYRTDWRGTRPVREEWAEANTELRRVFGDDGIGRRARVYVRYRRGVNSES